MTRQGPWCGGGWVGSDGQLAARARNIVSPRSGENVVPPLTRAAFTPRPWGGTRAAGMNGVLSRIDSRAHVMALVDKPCRHAEGQSTPMARESGPTESDLRPQWNLQRTTEKMSFINAVVWREMRGCFYASGKKSCCASVSQKYLRASLLQPSVVSVLVVAQSGRMPWAEMTPERLMEPAADWGGLPGSQRLRDGAKKDAGRGKR